MFPKISPSLKAFVPRAFNFIFTVEFDGNSKELGRIDG